MSAQFSTNEAVSLEKEIGGVRLVDTPEEALGTVYEIDRCIEWIRSHDFKSVCLQFPDHLLSDSTKIAQRLQSALQQTVYVLGDSAYESCCIDYITAAHANADAIIHYGPVCFSQAANEIPFLNIYEKRDLNLPALTQTVRPLTEADPDFSIVVDTEYLTHFDDIRAAFPTVPVRSILEPPASQPRVLILCHNQRKILNYKLSFKPRELRYYDPTTDRLVDYECDPKVLKRRRFLAEKIRDSNTIGIIIGTVAVKNYLTVLDRMKKVIKACGKKYYVISVGKPTVAKLANFAEMDVYVVVSCAMNEIYDSREFYKPIVTPYDVEVALNEAATSHDFTYNYNDYLSDAEIRPKEDADVSLITGALRSSTLEETAEESTEIAVRNDGTVALNTSFGAGFLAQRNWKGLEQNLGQDEVELASEGRRGIAQGYSNEKS
ncbi:hypothetical protein PPYR_03222 [Photinus pyralis]|uniref:Uncharacterized protein n=2 Tax=Photinus pyralis TaxID=7054 RepID=A0A5N4A287_PHOPY|nr:2-(3-amino-3-carboxypropyl)histidine synthase subunit 2 isoform X1 [Photinus pyralis]KAB0791422.1 hypothetical protein PPYR_03222 [Photinus pyralis]